jgi:hypothetical protein
MTKYLSELDEQVTAELNPSPKEESTPPNVTPLHPDEPSETGAGMQVVKGATKAVRAKVRAQMSQQELLGSRLLRLHQKTKVTLQLQSHRVSQGPLSI